MKEESPRRSGLVSKLVSKEAIRLALPSCHRLIAGDTRPRTQKLRRMPMDCIDVCG